MQAHDRGKSIKFGKIYFKYYLLGSNLRFPTCERTCLRATAICSVPGLVTDHDFKLGGT